MGLEDFMDGLDEPEDDNNGEDNTEDNVPLDEYKYDGDEELLDITVGDVRTVLENTEYDFEHRSLPINGSTFCIDSKDGSFILYVATSWEHRDSDCISISAIESEDKYDVMDPRLVFPTEGWKERVVDAIEDIVEGRSEIEYCDRCDSVMVYKRTNTTQIKIKGCSNYPDCKNREIIDDNTERSTIDK